MPRRSPATRAFWWMVAIGSRRARRSTSSATRRTSRSWRGSRDKGQCVLPLQRLGRDDLDAEAGEPDIGALGRGQQPDRGDPEVFEDLRAEADLAPLPAAGGLRAA